jgi:hypothetical protein
MGLDDILHEPDKNTRCNPDPDKVGKHVFHQLGLAPSENEREPIFGVVRDHFGPEKFRPKIRSLFLFDEYQVVAIPELRFLGVNCE